MREFLVGFAVTEDSLVAVVNVGHHDFDDFLDPVTPEAIDTVRAQASRESRSGVLE